MAPGDDLAAIPNDRPELIDLLGWGLVPRRVDNPDDLLAACSISKRVDDTANDSPDVVEPIDVGEKSGPGEFG